MQAEAWAWKGPDRCREQRGLPAREQGWGRGVRVANYRREIPRSGSAKPMGSC